MSTANGAILAMGTVFAHNIVRQLDFWKPDLVSATNLLRVTRIATLPLAIASTLIAAYYQNDNPQGATGYLLIVAFDVMMATAVVPLFGCFYCKNPRPCAALLSIIFGSTTRIVLEFTLPKDGYLLLPYKVPEFQKPGPAASARLPTFVDAPPEDVWDPTLEVCQTTQYEDFTGVNSLSALLVSFLVYTSVTLLEEKMGRPLFTFPGLQPYEKQLDGDDDSDDSDSECNDDKVVEEAPIEKEVELPQEKEDNKKEDSVE
jgi:Na+/proline symporter